MKNRNHWFHWFCMDCETLNNNSRRVCLSCGQIRSKVEITNQKRLDELYFIMNGRHVRSNKVFKP